MDVTIVGESKTFLDVSLSSVTLAEALRVYANKAGAEVSAWRQDHPTTNPVLHIEADNPKKILKQAIATLEKEISMVEAECKKF